MKTKISISAIALLLMFLPTWGNWDSKGELSIEGRQFNNDQTSQTYDSNTAVKTRLELGFRGDNTQFQIRGVSRVDSNDSTRDIVFIEELWTGVTMDDVDVRIGAQLLNWTALEAFHPVDVLNSRNYDSNVENAEKIGEPMIETKWNHQYGSLALYYMPTVIKPIFPESSNRLAFSSTDFGAPLIAQSDQKVGNDATINQWAFRADQTIDNTDLSIHMIQHIDRSQPVYRTSSTTSTTHPIYLPVTQLGGTVQTNIDDWLFKIEAAQRWFDGIDSTEFTSLDQKDHFQLALGAEYGWSNLDRSDSTIIIEHQAYYGVTKSEREALGLFQNDLLLGYRWALNDIDSRELFFSVIQDLERGHERLLSASYTQRILDTWKLSTGVRWVDAQVEGDTTEGLEQLESSDQVFITLTRHF